MIRSGLQSVADSSAVDEDLIEAALVDDDDTDGPTLSTNPASVEGVVQSDGGAPLGVTIELFSANNAETRSSPSTGADGTYRIRASMPAPIELEQPARFRRCLVP